MDGQVGWINSRPIVAGKSCWEFNHIPIPWNIGIWEYWNIGILEYGNMGILEYWNMGILEYGNIGILEYGNIGMNIPIC
jgi:hypothetical protein